MSYGWCPWNEAITSPDVSVQNKYSFGVLLPHHTETHFGSLLNSNAANQIIDRKIDAVLARPEGTCICICS